MTTTEWHLSVVPQSPARSLLASIPVHEESAADAEKRYLDHRFSLTEDSDIMEWWTQLLKLQAITKALGVDKSSRIDALKNSTLVNTRGTGKL